MSFFERAKAAASDLAAKADVAMTQAGINTPGAGGGADRALHDLGVIAYLEATGAQRRPRRPRARAGHPPRAGVLRTYRAADRRSRAGRSRRPATPSAPAGVRRGRAVRPTSAPAACTAHGAPRVDTAASAAELGLTQVQASSRSSTGSVPASAAYP